jgi:hypothetical protein
MIRSIPHLIQSLRRRECRPLARYRGDDWCDVLNALRLIQPTHTRFVLWSSRDHDLELLYLPYGSAYRSPRALQTTCVHGAMHWSNERATHVVQERAWAALSSGVLTPRDTPLRRDAVGLCLFEHGSLRALLSAGRKNASDSASTTSRTE